MFPKRNAEQERCYGYMRVSTEQQANDGGSLETQKEIIERWIKDRGAKLIMIEADIGISGTLAIDKRPGLAKILRNIRQGEMFLAIAMSRLARNHYEAINIIQLILKRGARFASIEEGYDTSTMIGETTMQIMSAISALQAKQISQYSRESAAAFKRLGRHTGGIPYGYKKKSSEPGSGLEEDPEQQQVITLIRDMRKNKMTFAAIAKELTKREIETPGKGKKWYGETVSKIHDRVQVNVKGRADVADKNTQEALTEIKDEDVE